MNRKDRDILSSFIAREELSRGTSEERQANATELAKTIGLDGHEDMHFARMFWAYQYLVSFGMREDDDTWDYFYDTYCVFDFDEVYEFCMGKQQSIDEIESGGLDVPQFKPMEFNDLDGDTTTVQAYVPIRMRGDGA